MLLPEINLKKYTEDAKITLCLAGLKVTLTKPRKIDILKLRAAGVVAVPCTSNPL